MIPSKMDGIGIGGIIGLSLHYTNKRMKVRKCKYVLSGSSRYCEWRNLKLGYELIEKSALFLYTLDEKVIRVFYR